ncbi:MAG: hypothetical protein ABI828_00590 [Actinomycetota bacterium]
MGRYPRVVTSRMWLAIRGRPGPATYTLLKRDPASRGDDDWTAISVFSNGTEAGDALDRAVAGREGDLDDYRVDEKVPLTRHWLRPSTWTASAHAR